jgi:hypothetical protein
MPSDNTTLIAVAAASGIVTPTVVASWARWSRRRDDAEAERERQLAAAADALNNVSRARALHYRGWLLWRRGLPSNDPEVQENLHERHTAFEQMWIGENALHLRLGSEHPIVDAYDGLVAGLEALAVVNERHGREPTTPSTRDAEDWLEAGKQLVRAKRIYVDTVRAAATEPRPWWRRFVRR